MRLRVTFALRLCADCRAVAASRQNYEDALEKLQEMIDTAAKPPTGPSDETIKKVKTLYVRGSLHARLLQHN